MAPQVRIKKGVPFKDFPNKLRLIDGTTIHRDQTRLLLLFKKAHTIQQVEGLLQIEGLLQSHSSSPITKRLVLESEATRSPGSLSSGPLKKPINHTSRRYWIRSQGGRPIEKTIIQILEASRVLNLERLGPVYRIPKLRSDGVLVCPLPHVLIVEPAPGIAPSEFDGLLTQLDLEERPGISQYLSGARYCVLKPNATHTVATAQKRFLTKLRPKIKTVLFDYMPLLSPDQAVVTPRDTLYPDTAMTGAQGQWNLRNIMADHAWGVPALGGVLNTTGRGVLVCHIDTKGVDVDHPDLIAAKFPPHGEGWTFDFPSSASPTYNNQQGPTEPHGTNCAGVIAARMNNQSGQASGTTPAGTSQAEGIAGVAPGCNLLSLRTYHGTWSEWAAAVGFAAAQGAKVICTCFKIEVPPAEQSQLNTIIDDVFTGGTVLVAAAGNENSSVVDFPAIHSHVIAVGASTGGMTLAADYRCKRSDWNPASSDVALDATGPNFGSNYGDNLSVVAPGVNIITTTIHTPTATPPDGYIISQFGTSLAAPHVAGLAALLIERFPALATNPQEVINIIERTAEKVHEGETDIDEAIYQYAETSTHPNGKWNQYLGYGRVNAWRALTFADVFICRYPGDVGDEPSTGSFSLGAASDIVVRPANDETWHPQDERDVTRAGQVVQGENICWVKVKNRGPADASNVRVRAAIVRPAIRPRRPLIRPRRHLRISLRISLNPIATAGVTVEQIPLAERNLNDPVQERLLISSIRQGSEQIVKFRIDRNTANNAKRWAGGSGRTSPLIILAEVTADNDYAYQDAPRRTGQDLVIQRNNLAQRKLYFI